MSQPTDATIQIAVATPSQYADSLQLVFHDVPEPDRTAMIDGLLEAERRGEESLDGLLVAIENEKLLGAIWAQIHPGRTAVLWPPRAEKKGTGVFSAKHPSGRSGKRPPSPFSRLIAHALGWLSAEGVTMVQSLLRMAETDDAARLRAAGFGKLIELAYLSARIDDRPRPPKTPLDFEPYRDDQRDRLGALIEQTYIDSLDCPALDGAREADDIIAGYQATGLFDPSRWFFVQQTGHDIGVLLLTDHPPARQWELVYMGLIPAARGNGWGEAITGRALWLAGQAGAERVVLAVDGANGPAGGIYERAGFVPWDRRTVWLRKFG